MAGVATLGAPGAEVVDPASNSVADSVKYAVRQGRTVRLAAAGMITRHTQVCSEKLPKSEPQGCTLRARLMVRVAVLSLLARTRAMSTRVACGAIRRSITHHCAEQARSRNGRSSPHPGDGGARVNKRLLDGAQALSRGPGALLARRDNADPFPDVPY